MNAFQRIYDRSIDALINIRFHSVKAWHYMRFLGIELIPPRSRMVMSFVFGMMWGAILTYGDSTGALARILIVTCVSVIVYGGVLYFKALREIGW